MQYRGAELFQLFKGKGSHAVLDNYRAILFADCVGKLSANAYRTAVIPEVARRFLDGATWQCGGIPCLGTEFPAFAARLLQEHAKATGQSEFSSWTPRKLFTQYCANW